jgi:hypothetical protein
LGCFRRMAATRRSHWVHLQLEQPTSDLRTLFGR